MELIQDEIAIEFENCFRYRISGIKTVQQKNDILSQMEEAFREAVRNKPSFRDELSKVYEELKIQCEKQVEEL